MSCFFSCFRVKDSGANPVAPPQEPAAPRSKNALSSLFQSDDGTLRKGEECQNRLPREIDVRDFKDENKFSKPNRTSVETPIKVRKALEKWEDASAQMEAEKFGSWLLNASMEKQEPEKQSNESSVLVASCSFLTTPSSCMTDGHYTGEVSSSSVQRIDVHNAVEIHSEQSKYESVESHHASDRSAISSISADPSASAGAYSVTKVLPYPNMEELDEEELGYQDSAISHQGQPNEQKKVDSVIEEADDEGSLTSWFKPISAKQDGSNKQLSSVSSQCRKPPADRPILGMVAAHWNDVEAPNDPPPPPKWWDGNGIPNSTNKYKEDQKVNWHATSFEERLEKALSEESLISQRKPTTNISTPFEFNETEESDTAMSYFQSSSRPKSVVSF
ncbi:protein JASON-like isoform X1 [Salvia splendens]|uniref:protein JASON-like isoform X1 n=1 Tax=Salvia splendens TaxID=180675 RepID=UPI001C254827|nr:protein JASON-like isoform X1 [Salvia splendens]